MRFIEYGTLPNGAHKNISCADGTDINSLTDALVNPVYIPDGTEIPATFPFVHVEAEELTYYRDVQALRDVTRTREVQKVDENGDLITGLEEYTEQELVTEQEEYTMLTATSLTENLEAWEKACAAIPKDGISTESDAEILNILLGVDE